MKVFTDENNPEQSLSGHTGKRAVLPDAKENTVAAGKWTKPSSGKVGVYS